jgi:CHAT domain-containing protein/Tfp pilus assembly protein PilF
MFRKQLCLFQLLLIFAGPVFSGELVRYEFSKDTSLANYLFKTAQIFQNKAEYDSAIYFYELSAKAYGKHKYFENYLKCRNKIITVKRSVGQTDGLFKESSENLRICLKKSGDSAAISAECYNIVGNLYADKHNQDSALFYFRKALSIFTTTTKMNDIRIAYTFRNIGVVYINKGLFDSARININKSTTLLIENYGEDHSELAGNYNSLGTIAYHMGQYDECEHYFGKVVRIREKSAGLFHPLTAEAYNNLAVLFMEKSMYDTALVLNQKAYKIRVSKLPENHPNIALSLNNIGNTYMAKGKLQEAIVYHHRALEIRQKIYKTETIDIAMSYANLGVLYREIGRFEEALNYFNKFLEITEKLFGPDNPHTSDAYNNVGAAYSDLGDYDKSLEYFKKALSMRKKRGEYSPGVSTSYNNIGSIYKYKGDYDLALSYYRRSIDIIRKLSGDNHHDLVRGYNNLGETYEYQEQYDTAFHYYDKALELERAILGEVDPDLVSIYLNRGNILEKLNEPVRATDDFRKGLTIAKNAFGEDHPSVANFYSAISSVLLAERQKDSALFFQNLSTRIKERCYPQKHPALASSYRENGEIFDRFGNSDSARVFYIRSLQANYTQPLPGEDFKTSLILDENEFAISLFDLCRFNYNMYLATDDDRYLNEIIMYFEHAKSIINSVISDFVLEDTRIKLLSQLAKHTYFAVDAASILFRKTGNTEYFFKAFEFSELNKSSVLQNFIYRYKQKRESDAPVHLLWKKKDLLGYTDFLQMELQKPGSETDRINFIKTRRVIDSLMLCLRDLNDSINFISRNSLTPYLIKGKELYEKIISRLGTKDALISYFISDSSLFTFVVTHDTLLLDRQTDSPAESLKVLINEYLSALKKYEKENIPRLNSGLYKLLFNNIENVIGSKERLIIIPDKYLFFLPFETLCREMSPVTEFRDFTRKDYLIRKHDFVYHYSIGLWCLGESGPAFPDNNGLVAFAPVFPVEKGSVSDSITDSSAVNENFNNDKSSPFILNRKQLLELPYYLAEVDSIKNMFDAHGIKTKVFTFNDASEENLKQNIEKFRFVHIATHGIMDNNHPEYSGLVFAANPVVVVYDSISGAYNDGILYAKDLYQMTINADLVVLSACETGMGKLEEGEGIIGLIRGFLAAGTKNLMFSFWKVGDKNTLIFMNSFYNSILNGNSFSTALRSTKIDLINNSDTSFPLLWGGFAIVGL